MIVAGGIEKTQTIKLVKKYFASYQGRAKKIKYTPLVRKKTKPDIKIRFKKLKQTQLALGGFAYSYNHPKLEAATLLSTILGGNMSSRLFTQVRDKRGLAYSIKMGLGKYQDIGNYVIQAGVDKEKVLETVKVILDELNKVKKDIVTKEELARAKDYIGGIMKISLEDSANLATWHGYQSLFVGKIVSPSQRLKKLKKVTQKQIQNVAQDIFCKQGLKLALIGPFKNKQSLLRILEKRI